MASGWTNVAVNKILNQILRGVAPSYPTTIYIGLFTATPSDTGGGTECTSGGYARQAITVGTSAFAAASGGATTNGTIIDFGTATGSFGGSITQWGIFDALTSGNLYFWCDLITPKTLSSGDDASFAIGTLGVGAT